MFLSGNKINKTIYYFFVLMVLLSVIFICGFSLSNFLYAGNDKVKEDKIKEDKVKEDKVKEDKVKEDKVKEDKNPKIYNITANYNNGGTISPDGSQKLNEGESITFTCAADEGFILIWLRVDNEKIEGINSYTFSDINSNHTIHAQFKKIENSDNYTDDNGAVSEDVDVMAIIEDAGDDQSNENYLDIIDSYKYGSSSEFNYQSIDFNHKNYLPENDEINNKKSESRDGKKYDIESLSNIIEINDTNQLLDIKAVLKKNEIIEILDVENLINEGNFIEFGTAQLDLSKYNDPFSRILNKIWIKIKDFSYYYNS